MALPTTGQISMGDINVELGRSRTSTISLDTAENGIYAQIRTNASPKPSATNPATISEWRGYQHLDLAPTTPEFGDYYLDSANTILLYWILSTNNPVSYELWRKTEATGTYTLRATIIHPTDNYLDTGSYDTEYFYKIRAKNSSGVYSGYSAEISIVTEPSSCFVEGTLITLFDNKQIPIEELFLNQLLLSAEIETLKDTNNVNILYKWNSNFINEKRINSPIKKIEHKIANKTIIINDGLLEATPEHSQLIQRNGIWKFIKFSDIIVGDNLYDIDKKIIPIKSISINNEKRNIYPLTLFPSHTYFANRILTHNVK